MSFILPSSHSQMNLGLKNKKTNKKKKKNKQKQKNKKQKEMILGPSKVCSIWSFKLLKCHNFVFLSFLFNLHD